jgi:hypothetical protein
MLNIITNFKHKLEILGIDPKLMICKITVLPIKLYPPKKDVLKDLSFK